MYFKKKFIVIYIFNVCVINRNNDFYDYCKNFSKYDGKLKNICLDNSFEFFLKKVSECKYKFSINWIVKVWFYIIV